MIFLKIKKDLLKFKSHIINPKNPKK